MYRRGVVRSLGGCNECGRARDTDECGRARDTEGEEVKEWRLQYGEAVDCESSEFDSEEDLCVFGENTADFTTQKSCPIGTARSQL